jgi:hypothetical protein
LDISKSEADLSQFGEDQLADGSIYFPVITKDSNGEPILTGGAPIAAAVSVSGRRGETGMFYFYIFVVPPSIFSFKKIIICLFLISFAAIPVKVIDNGDGTYNVAFVPTKLPGTYSIAVGLEDEDGHLDKNKDNQIKDFPLLVKLGPGVCMFITFCYFRLIKMPIIKISSFVTFIKIVLILFFLSYLVYQMTIHLPWPRPRKASH